MRFQTAIVKPDEVDGSAPAEDSKTIEEIDAESKTLTERERAIGLVATPVAAAVTLLVVPSLALNDITHAGTYHELLFVLLGMSVLMLATAWFRKRIFLGVVLALYGLGLFNLHQWGFGVPFILAGAWYLVRQYRLTQQVKLATYEGPKRQPRPSGTLARPSKRYTPPTERRPKPKPEKG